MKSILDKCYGFELDNLTYQNEGELSIQITELIISKTEIDLDLGNGKILDNLKKVEAKNNSKQFLIYFKEVLFYQAMDESYSNWDEYEIRDGKDVIQILVKSRYLNFINNSFPFYHNLDNKAEHFRILTLTDIIDVIAYDKPEITEIKN